MTEGAHQAWATGLTIAVMVVTGALLFDACDARRERLIKTCIEAGGVPEIRNSGDPDFLGCTPNGAVKQGPEGK